ncbi:unnamed protein product, partial [marine sediment metagenome]
FIALEDDTGSIGCSVTFKKEADALEEGDQVTVKGKLEEYEDNDGNTQRKLSGKVVKNKEEKKETTGEKKDNNGNNGKGDKNLYIARECAIKAAVELIAAKKIKYEELFPCTEKIVKYIYEGYQKPEIEELVKEELVEKLIKPERKTIGVLNKPALVPWANNLGLQGINVKDYVDDKADIGTLAHLNLQILIYIPLAGLSVRFYPLFNILSCWGIKPSLPYLFKYF